MINSSFFPLSSNHITAYTNGVFLDHQNLFTTRLRTTKLLFKLMYITLHFFQSLRHKYTEQNLNSCQTFPTMHQRENNENTRDL